MPDCPAAELAPPADSEMITGGLHCPARSALMRPQDDDYLGLTGAVCIGLQALFGLMQRIGLFWPNRSLDTVCGPNIVPTAGGVLIRSGQGSGALRFLKLATEHKGNLLVPSPPRLRLPSVTESVVLPPVSESHHAPHPTQPTQRAVTRPPDAGGHAPQGRGVRTSAGSIARRQDQKSAPGCNRFPCE